VCRLCPEGCHDQRSPVPATWVVGQLVVDLSALLKPLIRYRDEELPFGFVPPIKTLFQVLSGFPTGLRR
jgi:hypothetical protein